MTDFPTDTSYRNAAAHIFTRLVYSAASIAKIANVVKAVRRSEQIAVAIDSCANQMNEAMRQQVRGFAQQQGWQLL